VSVEMFINWCARNREESRKEWCISVKLSTLDILNSV